VQSIIPIYWKKVKYFSSKNAGGQCYRRTRSGYRHDRGSYFDSMNVGGKDECSEECGREDYCESFSYEYFALSTSKNCLLSRIGVRDIDSPDLEIDSNWDIYEYLSNVRECRDVSGGSGGSGGNSISGK
jgi:hypothetical protein